MTQHEVTRGIHEGLHFDVFNWRRLLKASVFIDSEGGKPSNSVKYIIWGLSYIKKQGSWHKKELAFCKREQVIRESITWGRIPHKAKLDKFKARRQVSQPWPYMQITYDGEMWTSGLSPALLISVGPGSRGQKLRTTGHSDTDTQRQSFKLFWKQQYSQLKHFALESTSGMNSHAGGNWWVKTGHVGLCKIPWWSDFLGWMKCSCNRHLNMTHSVCNFFFVLF